MEAGFEDPPTKHCGFQQVSGFCLTSDRGPEPSNRIVSALGPSDDGACSVEAIDFSENSTYTMISNNSSMSCGDGYTNYSDRMVTLGILDEVVAGYIASVTADGTELAPSIQGRIVCEDESCPTPVSAP